MHCPNCEIEVAPVIEFGGGNDPGKPTMGTVDKCPKCTMRLSPEPAKASQVRVDPVSPQRSMPVTTTEQIVNQAKERLAYIDVELARMSGLKQEARSLRRLVKAAERKN